MKYIFIIILATILNLLGSSPSKYIIIIINSLIIYIVFLKPLTRIDNNILKILESRKYLIY